MERTFYWEWCDFLCGSLISKITTLSRVVYGGLVALETKRFLFVLRLHRITWSKNHVTLYVIQPNIFSSLIAMGVVEIMSCDHRGWWPLLISHYLVMFSGHRPRESRNITFFICHVKSREHVIEKTDKFVVHGSLQWAAILTNLLATGLVEMDI